MHFTAYTQVYKQCDGKRFKSLEEIQVEKPVSSPLIPCFIETHVLFLDLFSNRC